MLERWTRLALIACLASLAARAEDTERTADAFKLSGYYKNILARSETVFPTTERYTVDLNRLRLDLRGRPVETISYELQYDNEVLLGSYLDTAQFKLQKDRPSGQYWKADANYAEGKNYYGLHRLYRAFVNFSSGNTDARFGRQRIAWGTGRFWSPTDLLNPISPTQLERDERPGTDALLLDQKFGPLSRLSAVYAPQHNPSDSSTAMRWHGNHTGVDYSIVGGEFGRDRMAGMDFASQIGGVGVRGEMTYTRPETGTSHGRAIAGLDYALPNTLILSAELYYNGAGALNPQNYDFASLFTGRIQNVGRRYGGFFAGYEITPLLKWNNYFVHNLADRSHYLSPVLAYSVKTNLEWSAGVQFFGGEEGSEYGRFHDVYYTQIQWYF